MWLDVDCDTQIQSRSNVQSKSTFKSSSSKQSGLCWFLLWSYMDWSPTSHLGAPRRDEVKSRSYPCNLPCRHANLDEGRDTRVLRRRIAVFGGWGGQREEESPVYFNGQQSNPQRRREPHRHKATENRSWNKIKTRLGFKSLTEQTSGKSFEKRRSSAENKIITNRNSRNARTPHLSWRRS